MDTPNSEVSMAWPGVDCGRSPKRGNDRPETKSEPLTPSLDILQKDTARIRVDTWSSNHMDWDRVN